MIALAMFSVTSASAQKGDRPEKPTPAQVTERMAEQLSLTDAQKSQVLDLNTEYQDVIGDPGMGGHGCPKGQKPDGVSGATDNSGDASSSTASSTARPQRPELTDEQKAKMEEMKAKRDEYNTKLKAILTADQLAKYEESQKCGPNGAKPDKKGKK